MPRQRRPLLAEHERAFGLLPTVRVQRRLIDRLLRAPRTGDTTLTRVAVTGGGGLGSHPSDADAHHQEDHITRHIEGGEDPFGFGHIINLDQIRFGHPTGPLLNGPGSGDILALLGAFDISAELAVGDDATIGGVDWLNETMRVWSKRTTPGTYVAFRPKQTGDMASGTSDIRSVYAQATGAGAGNYTRINALDFVAEKLGAGDVVSLFGLSGETKAFAGTVSGVLTGGRAAAVVQGATVNDMFGLEGLVVFSGGTVTGRIANIRTVRIGNTLASKAPVWYGLQAGGFQAGITDLADLVHPVYQPETSIAMGDTSGIAAGDPGGPLRATAAYNLLAADTLIPRLFSSDLALTGDSTRELYVKRALSGLTKTVDVGTGTMRVLGGHTHAADVSYVAEIDSSGTQDQNAATFRWSDDGGSTWDASAQSLDTDLGDGLLALAPIELQNGVLIQFGVGTYANGDRWTWTAIGTTNQVYTLRVDTTNDKVQVGRRLEITKDPFFYIENDPVFGPVFVFDGPDLITGDYISYVRAANTYQFITGGSVLLNLGQTSAQFLKQIVGLDGAHFNNFVDHQEIASPGTPGANHGRFFAEDVGGVPHPMWKDDAGTKTDLLLEVGAEHAIEIVIGDGSAAIPTGVWCALEVPYACTVKGWTLVSPLESGALVVDVWKDTYANWPPTVADTITGSEKPTITATGNKGQDLTLTTWTTALAKGDWLIFNVDSVTTITLATLSIGVVKT